MEEILPLLVDGSHYNPMNYNVWNPNGYQLVQDFAEIPWFHDEKTWKKSGNILHRRAGVHNISGTDGTEGTTYTGGGIVIPDILGGASHLVNGLYPQLHIYIYIYIHTYIHTYIYIYIYV